MSERTYENGMLKQMMQSGSRSDREIQRAKRLAAFLARITYKPGYRFHADPYHSELGILLVAEVSDVHPPHRLTKVLARHTLMPLDDDTEEGMLRAVRRLCQIFEAHEADEWLRLDGAAPFDPHQGEVRQ